MWKIALILVLDGSRHLVARLAYDRSGDPHPGRRARSGHARRRRARPLMYAGVRG